MASDRLKIRRCAIYTRKSSEEGLEQSYNSLAAQRDACAAYIASQKHEGWVPIEKAYDDGGFSGGSLERPALKTLFEDLRKGEVDIIVVYKVDRLTRSLADFAKLTELFDEHHVSFVAVTQQFNTSTSMGRLTLNVLLSFAQFEREVTGERIRDKIRASKQRGMWMGGQPPLGYDAKDRKLVVNEEEAKIVRHIFQRYLVLSSVRTLRDELKAQGITSKLRTHEDGSRYGGTFMMRGALDYLLKNRIYLGKIVHKQELFDGQHEPIVPQDLYDKVQHHLIVQGPGESAKRKLASPFVLQGLVFDETSSRLQPTHSNKQGRKYRYYVSASIIRDVSTSQNGLRVPAHDLEQLVARAIAAKLKDNLWLNEQLKCAGARELGQAITLSLACADEVESQTIKSTGILRKLIHRIEMGKAAVMITLNRSAIKQMLLPLSDDTDNHSDTETVDIKVDSHLLRCGKQMKLILGNEQHETTRVDPKLIGEIIQARNWFADLSSGKAQSLAQIASTAGCNQSHVSRRITLALLAPDIVEMILAGTQPQTLTPERLKKACPLPASWQEQRVLLLN